MLTIIATIRAQPAHADAVAGILAKVAIASRGEAGCRGYRLLRSTQDAALFSTFEHWADADAEARHLASSHVVEAFTAAGPLLAATPDIHQFREI